MASMEEIVSEVFDGDKVEITTTAEALSEAAGRLPTAERRLQKLRDHPLLFVDSLVNCAWWDCLEEVYICDTNLHRLFVGGKPSPAQNRLYNEFRLMVLLGSKLRANC
jgi:hypothetical protein